MKDGRGKRGGPKDSSSPPPALEEGSQGSRTPGEPPAPDDPQTPCRLFPLHGLSLLAGASGVGKTALLAGWIRTVIDGGTIMGAPARLQEGAQVGLVLGDRSLRNNSHWMDRAGLQGARESGKLQVYSIIDDDSFPAKRLRVSAEHPALFQRCLGMMQLPPGSLVIFDPISLFLGGKLIDYSCTAAAMIPLQRIARGEDLAVLGVHHISKQKRDGKGHVRAQDRILGSTALLGYSDTQVWVVGPEETGKPTYLVGYSSHSELGKRFEYTRDKQGMFVQLTRDPLEKLKEEAKGNQEMALLRLVGVEPTAAVSLVKGAEELGIGRTSVFRVMERLLMAGAVSKDGHGRYRRLVALEGGAG